MIQYWELLAATSKIQRKSEQNLTFEKSSRSSNERKVLNKMKQDKRRFHILKFKHSSDYKTEYIKYKAHIFFSLSDSPSTAFRTYICTVYSDILK